MRLLARTLCCLAVSAQLAFAGDPAQCEAFAKSMTSQAVAVFHNSALNETQKRAQLTVLFHKAVDTDWIGKYVLGRYWRDATPEQQQNYLKIYSTYVANSYVSKFNEDDGMSVDDIKVVSVRPGESSGYEANTAIIRKGQEDVRVDWLLDDSTGSCRVHDIKVEGVSLLITQRSDFSAIGSKGGIDAVIAALKGKARTSAN